jgi:diguanylate cyclase (GGDEF)-like protein
VLILNLDHFEHINETLGRPIGDMLLREVAARLRSVVRRANDSVARTGGDEFAILMAGSRPSDAQRVAEAVARALEVKMTLDGHVVDVRASIGVAVCPDHGHDPAKLLQRAEVAMRAAKREQLKIVMWDDRYDENGEKRLSMMSDLKKAVDNEELTLIYQPRVPLGDSGEHYVEALVRWQHPTRGLVPPSEFVPLAEQTGFIRTISQWVLDHAIAQCAEWRSRGLPMNVSVNISPNDLISGELVARLAQTFEKEGCSAQWLTLEVTENAIVGEPGPEAAGMQARAGRLRYRVLVSRILAKIAARRAQDRQVVHDGHGDGRERCAHRPLDDRARAQARPYRRRRRRRRRGDAQPAARARLRRGAGLPAVPPARCRGRADLGTRIELGASGAREDVAAASQLVHLLQGLHV